MAALDADICKAVSIGEDGATIMHMFNNKYSAAIHPPISVLNTWLLVSATEYQHSELFEHLLTTGVDVNNKFGSAGALPLHAAVRVKRLDFIRRLLKCGASVNLPASDTLLQPQQIVTAIEMSLLADNCEILDLLESGYICPSNGRTLLHAACYYGAFRCVHHLLESPTHRANINVPDTTKSQYRPVMFAVRHSAQLARLLIQHGASTEVQTFDRRQTLLHLAADRSFYLPSSRGFMPFDFPDIIQLLLAAGCDVNAVSGSGQNALSLLSCHVNSESIVAPSSDQLPDLPYDIRTHQRLLIESFTLLLRAGAKADIGVVLPVDILLRYLQMDVDLVVSDAVPVSCGQIAVETYRHLLNLLAVNGPVPSTFQYHSVISCILERMCQYYSSTKIITDQYVHIFIQLTDVIRILLLVGPFNKCSNILSALFRCVIAPHHIFISLFEVVLNVLDEPCICKMRHDVHQHIVNDARLMLSHKERLLADREISTQMSPRSLKQISRLTILSSLSPSARIHHVSNLTLLPQALIDYILSLRSC